ncbi:NIPSNAP family protein [Amycolatopsis sp. FBCC-B4732]|uniref:NIPSNAP family protein n=1 Tax=Amycolatopsis sp. FBCC-B4732 TaxID=3079339 RepID=UPI001FF1F828|nr:NIPSNAP family protein [Amycolatopsis sp. FBCC-B4732]UOX92213.1 NIPSNAP family protein [Amycolatopsis sp. FBCC-B4732]
MFYEIRTEHARPGRGAELARYLDETVIPLHQELEMRVVGSFTVAGDEDAVVWIRRFENDTDREHILNAVHRDPRCAALAETVAALTAAPPSTVRLAPTAGSLLR